MIKCFNCYKIKFVHVVFCTIQYIYIQYALTKLHTYIYLQEKIEAE